ncbi:MAG: class II aldolase/adducin family protein [Candidatus Gastranaerophilales bacterium]|nr:class II aldolase/adducin family protein [Candidatus Gastranaerophilales bacterium]
MMWEVIINMNGYEEFCKYCKILYEKGLAPGCSGNASIRKASHIAITSSGVSLYDITPENIVELDFEGNNISSGKASTEKMMHVNIYNNRPDVNAIIHEHSPFLSTFALAGKAIENSPIIELKYLFNDKVPLISYNPPGSPELANEVAEVLKTCDAAIMQNHGAIVVAKSIKEALYKYEVLEYTAQVIIQKQLLEGHI